MEMTVEQAEEILRTSQAHFLSRILLDSTMFELYVSGDPKLPDAISNDVDYIWDHYSFEFERHILNEIRQGNITTSGSMFMMPEVLDLADMAAGVSEIFSPMSNNLEPEVTILHDEHYDDRVRMEIDFKRAYEPWKLVITTAYPDLALRRSAEELLSRV